MSRAPRIDTLRNRIEATQSLLTTVLEELEDLHVLAYERAVVSREAKVSGGERDYALDTHGDPKVREAYRALGDVIVGDKLIVDDKEVLSVCDLLAVAAHDVIRILRNGERNGRLPRRRINAEEHALALENQTIRLARGEYTPVRREPQPEAQLVEPTVRRIVAERDGEKTRADRATRRLHVYEPPKPEPKRGRRRRRKGT